MSEQDKRYLQEIEKHGAQIGSSYVAVWTADAS